MKKFTFTATTKSSIKLELFATLKNGEMRIGAKSPYYEHTDVGHFVQHKDAGWCIKLNNKYINEKLIGVQAEGLVAIQGFDEEEVKRMRESLKIEYENQLKTEINSLVDDDIVILSWMTTSYGPTATLRNEKLSYPAGKKFESAIKVIHDQKWVEFTNIDPFADYSVSLEAKMPYAEFRRLCEKASALQKERKEQAERERQKREEEKRDTEANELFLWDAGTIYASSGNKMLHSLGAIFSKETISIYTTTYANDIPKATTTSTIKDKLKSLGFTFNPKNNQWDIEHNSDNSEKVIALLKEHDTKIWPDNLGMVRCWECGTYFKPKRGDFDGSGYYCGC